MKKLITILLAFMLAITVNAQTLTMSTGSGTYAYRATGFTLTNAVAQWSQINGYTDWITTIDYSVDLDSLAGNHTNVAVALYGRKFSNVATWTQIGSTVNWKGTTSDTTIVISTTSGSRWREYKALITGTGTGTTTVSNQYFKLWFQ